MVKLAGVIGGLPELNGYTKASHYQHFCQDAQCRGDRILSMSSRHPFPAKFVQVAERTDALGRHLGFWAGIKPVATGGAHSYTVMCSRCANNYVRSLHEAGVVVGVI